MNEHVNVMTVSSSQAVASVRSILFGLQVGMDAINDPTITVYDGTDNTGNEIVPTTTYDASALGLNGFTASYAKKAYNGIYVEISCAGTVEVTVDYREA